MSERKSVWFHEICAPDLVDDATNVCDVAILPLGAIEQHGPHTPCAVDAFNAIGMTEMIAKKSGDGEYRFDIRLQGEGETVFLDM